MPDFPRRVVTVAPLPPEKCAYALARYSRSPDPIAQSLEWVRTHDSAKFLESFYFQYGHGSIADLGHLVMCFEGMSELAATEIEDEQLWDGQARSSRYQNFSKSGFVTPPEFDQLAQQSLYTTTANRLLDAYKLIHEKMVEHLTAKLPRPESLEPAAYKRNVAARAFDVARYCLFWGIPTGVGQVTSIRTLERQIRRFKASDYQELRDLAHEIADACKQPPVCRLEDNAGSLEPLAPTLAKYVDTDAHLAQARLDLRAWAQQMLPEIAEPKRAHAVDLIEPRCVESDVAATLLFSVTNKPYRGLYEIMNDRASLRREAIDVALRSRTRRDELLSGFRGGPFVYDMVMDLGAYRDMHRHRRCQQARQDYTTALGYEMPDAIVEAGLETAYRDVQDQAVQAFAHLPRPGAEYVLPFSTRGRFLFKMDFAEVEYISRLRSGVKGHFSYRRIAWEMKQRMDEMHPELGRLIQATPPEVEDPLTR
jgi:thymidylate synthase ThyX